MTSDRPGLVRASDGTSRCWWGAEPEEYRRYHDEEWGRPVRDDRAIYEKLTLEAFQSGLSWLTILRKRENFRTAFDGFEPERVAAYGPDDVARLLADTGIVRNRAKIHAAVTNAAAVVRLTRDEGRGALTRLLWSVAPTCHPRPRTPADVPARTPESATLARRLKDIGMVFVGPTTAYAAMQALGVVDDHLTGCCAVR